MRKRIAVLSGLSVTLLTCQMAFAYGHANRWGGGTSHSFGSTRHSNAFGGDTSHTAGEGTSHTNAYGGDTSHAYGGGTSHTNVYGGTTSGAYGAGAVHTTPYGGTAYQAPDSYYGYHPPVVVNSYGAGCYNCGGWSAAGAAAAGAVAGAVTGAAVASANNSAASSNAYTAGYAAGAANAVYTMGATYATLPGGCTMPDVEGKTYYLCGNTWFSPFYGANGVNYQVVPVP